MVCAPCDVIHRPTEPSVVPASPTNTPHCFVGPTILPHFHHSLLLQSQRSIPS